MAERTISGSVLVEAPPDVIFAILTDPRQHGRIDGSGTVRGVMFGPPQLALGDEFGVSMRLRGVRYKIRNRVVELVPGRRIAWRHPAGHRWRYELEPTGETTTVTETFDATTSGPGARFVTTVLGQRRRNVRAIPATLQRLKHAAESDAARGRTTG